MSHECSRGKERLSEFLEFNHLLTDLPQKLRQQILKRKKINLVSL